MLTPERMVRPAAEIIAEIVDEMRRARYDAEKIEFDAEQVALDAKITIRTLKTLYPPEQIGLPLPGPVWGHRDRSCQAIEAVRKQIARLHETLRDMPGRALYLLFEEPTPRSPLQAQQQTEAPRLKLVPGGQRIDGANRQKVPSYEHQQATLARETRFLHMLAVLRARCDELAATKPGEHGNADYRQRHAAEEARDLMLRNGRRPASASSATSPFRKIAALLYEAVTGNASPDIARACREAFKEIR